MSVECTNPNLISAQLGQPAPKFELDLYIPKLKSLLWFRCLRECLVGWNKKSTYKMQLRILQLCAIFLTYCASSSNSKWNGLLSVLAWRCCWMNKVKIAWLLDDWSFIFVEAVVRLKAPCFRHCIVSSSEWTVLEVTPTWRAIKILFEKQV